MNKKESDRAEALLQAQSKANELFHAVEARGLIRANVLESQLHQEIYDLAEQMFGISTYWHKRIVRAGRNTLEPYEENPPDLTVGEDDIVFLDLGPVFEEWEADFGRTFVLGSDPVKLKLRDDIEKAFTRGKEYFNTHPDITAAELYGTRTNWLGLSVGNTADPSQGICLVSSRTNESQVTRSRCTFTLTTPTECGASVKTVRNATGFSRCTS